MQVKQEKGEFVVLNAAAYHAGFNMGFNCAEAINFATEVSNTHTHTRRASEGFIELRC